MEHTNFAMLIKTLAALTAVLIGLNTLLMCNLGLAVDIASCIVVVASIALWLHSVFKYLHTKELQK